MHSIRTISTDYFACFAITKGNVDYKLYVPYFTAIKFRIILARRYKITFSYVFTYLFYRFQVIYLLIYFLLCLSCKPLKC